MLPGNDPIEFSRRRFVVLTAVTVVVSLFRTNDYNSLEVNEVTAHEKRVGPVGNLVKSSAQLRLTDTSGCFEYRHSYLLVD